MDEIPKMDMAEVANLILGQLQVPPVRSGEKREKILEAALELMSEFGYRKTTVDEIANKSGVAKGTVYIYFKDKQEILMTVVRERLAALVILVTNEVTAEKDIPSRLLLAIKKVIEYHSEDAILNKIFTKNPEMLVPVITGVINDIEEIVCMFIQSQLLIGIEDGSIERFIDVEMTAKLLFRMNQNTIMRIKTGEKIDVDQYIYAFGRMVLLGITPRSES